MLSAAIVRKGGVGGPGAEDGLEPQDRRWAMLTIVLGVLLSGLDSSIANVALPTISRELAASPAAAVWVVNAYQLAVAIFILPFSSLSERIGYRRVYWAGLLCFTLASLGCASAHSFAVLVAARTLQGVGGAAISGVSQALVRYIYPRRILGSGMSWYTLMLAVSASLGPIVGAAILSVANWPWLFTINLPIGALALIVGARALPESPRRAGTADPIGAILNALFFGLLILGLDGLGVRDADLLSLAKIAVGLGFGALLWVHQARKPTPMLPVDLFRIPIFALSSLTSVCSYAAQTMALLATPFYVQNVLGRGQSDTGLIIAPWPLSVMLVARLAGAAADRYPAGLLAGLGLTSMATGLGLLASLPPNPSTLDIMWRVALCGLGFGFFQTPNNRAMMTAGPKERSGGANGAMGASRMLGQTGGAAIAAATFASTPGYGFRAVFVIALLFAASGAGISFLRLAPRRESR